MTDEPLIKKIGMSEAGEDVQNEQGSQVKQLRSENVLDGYSSEIIHGHVSEPESEPAGPSALATQDVIILTARVEGPSIPSSVQTPPPSSKLEDTNRRSRGSLSQEGHEHNSFSQRHDVSRGPDILKSVGIADLSRAGSPSALSSKSGDGIKAGQADSDSAPESPSSRPSVWTGHAAQTTSPNWYPEPGRPTSLPTRRRRDGPEYPSYPNQSFSALQAPTCLPFDPPHPLRARHSHSSQGSLNASTMEDFRHPNSVASGAKTVGGTPIHSPRLSTPTMSRNRASGDESEDSHYNTPLLYHAHLQAPIETNKLQKDFDPISGRKMVNNYEFLSKLGSGAHGTVKLGKNIENSELVAIKIVRRFSKKIRFGKPPLNPDDMTKKEVAILKKARHPHVVRLIEVIDDNQCGKVYLVLEYVELGEIVWRKRTDIDIARFEMSRVEREKSGHFHEGLESAEIQRFNEARQLRQEEKARRGQAHHRGRSDESNVSNRPRLHVKTSDDPPSNPDGGSTPFWSLEYGNNSEEELPSTFHPLPNASSRGSDHVSVGYERRHQLSMASLESSTPAQSDTPRPSQPSVGEFASLRTASNLNSRSRPASLMQPQGNFVQPYFQGHSSTDKAPEPSARERTRTQAAAEEAEFLYVPCLTISQALDAFRDTVLGLEYLHYQGIIHRDIKPANLLWTSARRVKISDFGVSYLGRPRRGNGQNEEIAEPGQEDRDEARELAKTVGTPAFYAPELCDPRLCDFADASERPLITGQIDVWALGVTLYGMIFGRLPFFDHNAYAMYEKIAMQEVFIPRRRLRAVEADPKDPSGGNKRPDDFLEYEDVDEELRDLLKRLLEKHPSKRISLTEVKQHPWVVRGISDISAWMDQTDPSVQSQGKKIEVSTQEVQEALVGLRFVELIRTGMKGIRSIVRGRDGRKRGNSNAKTSESQASTSPAASKASASSHDRRRSSLRGDEQIYSALRASREGSEHPLSQSVAASPDMKEGSSYFDMDRLLTVSHEPASGEASSGRPTYLERTLSNAESTKTIRAPVPASMQEIALASAELFPPFALSTDFGSSSSLGGIFGGAGRRFVQSMRSRERNRDRDSPSISSRSSSVAVGAIEDPHGSPSVAVTAAIVAGYVDPPPVPQDPITSADSSLHEHEQDWSSSMAHVKRRSCSDALHIGVDEGSPRPSSEHSHTGIQHHRRISLAAGPTHFPSVDDGAYPIEPFGIASRPEQSGHAEDLPFPVSSSSDQIASGMSESTSYPSIPSVISGASSLSAHADECHPLSQRFVVTSKTASEDSLGADIYQSAALKLSNRRAIQASLTTDDDEAGYNGEGESDSDDGIEMGGRKSK